MDGKHQQQQQQPQMASDGHELMLVSGEELQELQEEDLSLARPRKKQYHHHTQHQIQELEAFFKKFPHPDDKQRKELSQELGLEPLQVKFWFQNKRSQMKTQQARQENTQLRAENEQVRAENAHYKARTNACPSCGPATFIEEPFDEHQLVLEMSFDEHQLRLENVRLQDMFGVGPQ